MRIVVCHARENNTGKFTYLPVAEDWIQSTDLFLMRLKIDTVNKGNTGEYTVHTLQWIYGAPRWVYCDASPLADLWHEVPFVSKDNWKFIVGDKNSFYNLAMFCGC